LVGGAALGLALLGSGFETKAEIKFYPDVVLIEYYENISGTAVSALTGNPKFPNSPDQAYFGPIPEIPSNSNNNYGVRIRGVLIPTIASPESYYLIMCSDDNGELHLSSNTNAANKVLIAREPEWNNPRTWFIADRRPDTAKIDPAQPGPNISVPQLFNPGEQRYFELLMKEGGGGDNLAMTTYWDINPVPPGPANGSAPDFTGFQLGVYADDVPRVISGPRLKTGSAVAGQETTLTATYYVPPGTASYQWFRNDAPITGATTAEYTFTPAAGDAGANYSVQVTVDGKASTRSPNVALRFDAFSFGFAKVEFFNDIGGATDVASLINSTKYQAGTPDEIRFVTAAATPTDYADNYGARLSFMFIPDQDGDYRFFTRSDDASAIYLSTDGTLDVTTATKLAEETGCCNAFTEPESPRTSAPQSLVGGQTNVIFGLVKEGGGGDFLQIAVRQEGDTTSAPSLRPVSGGVIGVMANATGIGGISVAQNPAGTNIVEGQTAVFEARGVVTPAGTPVVYQWQKNGVNIPGASGSRLTLTNVSLADNNTRYRAIAGTIGGLQATTTEATLTVVPDTFPPVPRLAALRTASGEFQVSVTFDEQVDDEQASNQVNYSVSPGTISTFKYWPNDQGVVLSLSGVTAGQTINVTVDNVKDLKNNEITTPVTRSVGLSNLLSWTGIGEDTYNRTLATDAYSDGAVALGPKDFDLISGGDANWDSYDEATFVYEEVTGDFDRAVRVEFQDTTSQWARTGLMVREVLDTGVTHAEVTAGYRMSQTFTIRVNPTATCIRTDPGNNSYEVLHRPVQGGVYDGARYPTMFAIQGGFGGAPNYPTAWMRVRRQGQTIEAYKSDDGVTWTGPATITYADDLSTADIDETLAPTVFVGMYYAPEMANNNTATCFGHSALAKFRDYGPFSTGGGGRITITRSGNNVTLSWPGGRLQSATSLNGPTVTWSEVSGASPVTIPAGTGMRFFRTISP
jgi:hypothetical protein